MTRPKTPKKGDVYWIDSNPVPGMESQNKHRFIVITPKKINELGIVMTIPVASGGILSKNMGLTVPILGYNTEGIAVCNQIRSFDISTRVQLGTARYIETLDEDLSSEIVNRVLSVIEPSME
ncbi:MAG: type II toxin-antitoxin system PemK/MazF family toxin [Myxococcaceae bacterium]